MRRISISYSTLFHFEITFEQNVTAIKHRLPIQHKRREKNTLPRIITFSGEHNPEPRSRSNYTSKLESLYGDSGDVRNSRNPFNTLERLQLEAILLVVISESGYTITYEIRAISYTEITIIFMD